MSPAQLSPALGWVLVELNPVSNRTEGGIIIPDTAMEKEREGESRTFRVLATPDHTIGIHQDGVETFYPKVGSDVLVQGKAAGVFQVGKETFLVRLDTIMGVVS